MLDRFKFRFWDGHKMQNEIHSEQLEDDSVEYMYFSKEDDCFYTIFNNELDINGFSLMQCTGLKDKNKKLIFEGDIILFNKDEIFAKVMYWDGAFRFDCINIDECWTIDKLVTYDFEIIGNIYKNSGLLGDE